MEGSKKSTENLQLEELARELHAVLRALVHPHSNLDLSQLTPMLPSTFSAECDGSAQQIREVLAPAMDRLTGQSPDLAKLLRGRFWESRTMEQLSMDFGRSVSGLYAMQAQALKQLAGSMWEIEYETFARRQESRARRFRNLPPANYPCLFGVDGLLSKVHERLVDPQGPRVISIEGLGGSGKTALVNAAVRNVLSTGQWKDLAWVSAVDRPFYQWETPDTPPPLDPDRILEQIAWQLDLREIASLSADTRRDAMRNRLSRDAFLIIIEDLEPEHRPNHFLPSILSPQGPTRAILTSRLRLPAFPGCVNFQLKELSRESSLDMLAFEAKAHGISVTPVLLERMYAIVGGNPLAMKLAMAQTVHLPFERVLENLVSTAQGAIPQNILQQIYRHIWKLLPYNARCVLYAMSRFSPLGATYADLQSASGLSSIDLDAALRTLVEHSLLSFDPAESERYTMSRLTYIFLWTVQAQGGRESPETKPVEPL